MKKKERLLSMMMMLLLISFAACDSDDNKNDETTMAVPAVIQGKIFSYDTGDAGNVWSGAQLFGTYMLKSGTTEIVDPKYNNAPYFADNRASTGYFVPSNTDSLFYFPENGDKVDIVAYYPRKTVSEVTRLSNDGLYPMSVYKQNSVSALTIYYCKATGLSKTNKKAEMQFKPLLPKLNIKFSPDTESGMTAEDLEAAGLWVKVNNAPTQADLNLLNGEFENQTVPEDEKDGITLIKASDASSRTASGYLFSSSNTEDYEIAIYVPGKKKTYTWKFNEKCPELTSSMEYTLEFKVSIATLELVAINETPAISDWGNNGSETNGEGDYGQEDLVVGGDFSKVTSLVKYGNGDGMLKADMQTWGYSTNLNGTVEVQDGTIHMVFTSGSPTWHNSALIYKSQGAKATTYELSFWAKSTNSKSMFVFIRVGTATTNLFIADSLNETTYPIKTVTLTNEWKAYSYQFNFARVRDTKNSLNMDITPEQLNEFVIGIAPNNGANVLNEDFYIDNIRLKRVLN